jgi:hypothetical protein
MSIEVSPISTSRVSLSTFAVMAFCSRIALTSAMTRLLISVVNVCISIFHLSPHQTDKAEPLLLLTAARLEKQ